MNRIISPLFLSVFLVSTSAGDLFAQVKRRPQGTQRQEQQGTRSHRRIPLGRGLNSAGSAISKALQNQRPRGNPLRRDGSGPGRFVPGGSGRSSSGLDDSAGSNNGQPPPDLEPSQFSNSMKELLDRDPIEDLQQLGRGLGESISNLRQGGSLWERDKGISQSGDQSARSGFGGLNREIAEELLKKSWPDTVAPEQWLRKVKPFISSEVIQQILEAREQFEAQSNLDPAERRFQNLEKFPAIEERVKSKSMIDSLMKNLDKKSTDWLKSSDKKGKMWRNLSQSARRGIASLNQKMTANSQKRASENTDATSRSYSPFRNGQPTTNNRTPDSSVSRGNGASTTQSANATQAEEQTQSTFLWILVGAALLLGAGIYLFRDRFLETQPAITNRVLANRIHDRDSLLAACHALALDLFGFRSRFWHHRKLFAQLAERMESKGQAVNQLSSLYEQARYAPRKLLDTELIHAKKLFVSLQENLRAEA